MIAFLFLGLKSRFLHILFLEISSGINEVWIFCGLWKLLTSGERSIGVWGVNIVSVLDNKKASILLLHRRSQGYGTTQFCFAFWLFFSLHFTLPTLYQLHFQKTLVVLHGFDLSISTLLTKNLVEIWLTNFGKTIT